MIQETVIIGASPFAVGYAEKHPNTRIFERGFLSDPCFSGTLCGFEITDENSEYSRLFPENGLLFPGIRDLPFSEAALAGYILKKGIALSFGTEAVSFGDGHTLTYTDNEGLHEEAFSRIIDGRTETKGNRFRFTVRAEKTPEGPFIPVLRMSNDLYLLEAEFSEPVFPAEAKMRVLEGAKNLLPEEAGIVSMAVRTFSRDVRPPYTDGKGILRIDPLWFGTPEEAFRKGGLYE